MTEQPCFSLKKQLFRVPLLRPKYPSLDSTICCLCFCFLYINTPVLPMSHFSLSSCSGKVSDKRFIGEYASNANSLYRKRLSIEGRLLHLEVFDPCSQVSDLKCILEEPVEWADGFIVVYNISDRTSFLNAQNILCQIKEAQMDKMDIPICLVGYKQDLCHAHQVFEEEGCALAQEHRCHFQEVSAAEDYLEISNLFTNGSKSMYRADLHRYSGSKSMAKLINNVFGKRRKSV
uniref:small monomeric GTPase n=1 Tax=Oncorhynchus tshawytscha TaxID=74940 RepID=A0AAZ3RL35_ONCTS